MKRLLTLLFAFFVIQAAFAGGYREKTDKGEIQVPLTAKARVGVLSSGLRYYLLANNTPENRAYLTLAVNVGSVVETEDERGLAHFVEHMAFNGTERFPGNELDAYIQSLGMRLGADSNAYTSFDETIYGIIVPTEINTEGVKVIPEKALNIIDDWTHAVLFNEKDVDDERPIILEEKRMRTNAVSRIFQENFLPVLFAGSPYAERMPIGLENVIANAPASRLQNFYQKWYRADNMALIIVGDFDVDALETSLPSYFDMSAPQTPLNRPFYDLPPPQPGRLDAYIFTDSEMTDTFVYLYWKRVPKPVDQTIAFYRESVIDRLVDYVITERLNEAADAPESPFTEAFSGNVRYGTSSRFWMMGARAKTGSMEQTLAALLREKERISRYGFTKAEIDRAKAALISILEAQASEKKRESSSFVNDFVTHFIRNRSAPDAEWELYTVRSLLPRINNKEVSTFARNYFADDDLTVFLVAPDGEELPSKERIFGMVGEVKKAKKSEIARPQSKVFDVRLLKTKPTAGVILNESVDEETGAVIWELGNGAKVVLKQTENKKDEIVLYALARGGVTSIPATETSEILSARLAPDLLAASGAGAYSLQELIKKLATVNISLSFNTYAYTRTISGSSTVKDITSFFELLYLHAAQMRLDPSAVKATLSKYRTYLANQEKDPESVFRREVLNAVFDGSPYFKELEVSDIDMVNPDMAFAFLKRALNPMDYVFVFTGNIDIAQLKSLTLTYLASIPVGAEKWDDWVDVDFSTTKNVEKTLKKGKEEKSHVYLAWKETEPYTEEVLATAVVLTEYLNTVFNNKIREELGGVYSIYTNVGFISLPPSTSFLMEISFPCNPKNVENIIVKVKAEVQNIAEGLVDRDILSKAKETVKKSWETSIQDNSFIAVSYADSAVIYRSPFSRLDKRPSFYQKVSEENLRDMAAKFFTGGHIRMVMFPE
ncbi:MAG: insulinase family protein [Treponema sp.]|jgi:zinc protease|nr:insulinase family protein [Treponema sp.]